MKPTWNCQKLPSFERKLDSGCKSKTVPAVLVLNLIVSAHLLNDDTSDAPAKRASGQGYKEKILISNVLYCFLLLCHYQYTGAKCQYLFIKTHRYSKPESIFHDF